MYTTHVIHTAEGRFYFWVYCPKVNALFKVNAYNINEAVINTAAYVDLMFPDVKLADDLNKIELLVMSDSDYDEAILENNNTTEGIDWTKADCKVFVVSGDYVPSYYILNKEDDSETLSAYRGEKGKYRKSPPMRS
jgi:hypothetical protein